MLPFKGRGKYPSSYQWPCYNALTLTHYWPIAMHWVCSVQRYATVVTCIRITGLFRFLIKSSRERITMPETLLSHRADLELSTHWGETMGFVVEARYEMLSHVDDIHKYWKPVTTHDNARCPWHLWIPANCTYVLFANSAIQRLSWKTWMNIWLRKAIVGFREEERVYYLPYSGYNLARPCHWGCWQMGANGRLRKHGGEKQDTTHLGEIAD